MFNDEPIIEDQSEDELARRIAEVIFEIARREQNPPVQLISFR